ncbi:NOB1 family endonuclease [Halomarina ordinaria]|uniref:NOB1 family endonuclease n=1 Tax=Halomarina ordinaria TaxID=3033939 RepID=A0ABD5UEL8_9EURY|nr:NOB1 family endonuclease [Halomarina sp. PSRA2]
MRVLDASAFIRAYDAEGPTASIPLVREELTQRSVYRFDALEGAGMHVHVPNEAAVDRVRSAASATGDRDVLSATDTRLLAAALELDATLVTDDYAMQNVAAELDIPVEAIGREGISEERSWSFQCVGCGRTFDAKADRCPVCGSDLTRKR